MVRKVDPTDVAGSSVNEKHVEKQDFEKPYAVMSAHTDMWEFWASHRPVPPEQTVVEFAAVSNP
jgi:hypothetical protein